MWCNQWQHIHIYLFWDVVKFSPHYCGQIWMQYNLVKNLLSLNIKLCNDIFFSFIFLFLQISVFISLGWPCIYIGGLSASCFIQATFSNIPENKTRKKNILFSKNLDVHLFHIEPEFTQSSVSMSFLPSSNFILNFNLF